MFETGIEQRKQKRKSGARLCKVMMKVRGTSSLPCSAGDPKINGNPPSLKMHQF